MNKEVKSWLAVHYNTSDIDIDSIVKNETMILFLITWSIFEQTCFEGFMKKEKILEFVEKIATSVDMLKYEEAVKHFYDRYQDDNKFKGLVNREHFSLVEVLLKKKYLEIVNTDKLIFLVYVIYRFRNNIFHGNKEVRSWSKYEREIELCTYSMTKLIESNIESRV